MHKNTPPEQSIEEMLNQTLAEFDAKTEAFSEFEVVDRMRAALGNRELSEAERDLYYGESNAFFFRGHMREDDPFPEYFQPTFGLPQPDGTTSWTPDPANLISEMTER